MKATEGYRAASCSKLRVVREPSALTLPVSGWNGVFIGVREEKLEGKLEGIREEAYLGV